MKLASAVVLYNPDKSILDNIQTYLPFSDVLYVMDNSTNKIEFIDEIKKLDKVEYVSMHGNQGIAAALKMATEKAITDGYDFLLTMDQDSQYPTEDFPIVKKYLLTLPEDVAIVTINYTDCNLKVNVLSKNFTTPIEKCITSGSIISLRAYQTIAGFNADLFIDFFDHDLSLQFLEKKYQLVIFPNICLKHALGTEQHLKFLWIKKERHIHSPLRYYYQYRNYNYLKRHSSKTYRKILEKIFHREFAFIASLKRICLQSNHYQIYKMIRRGIHDGKKGILGPYKEKNK